jgi:hypothetical protein
MTGAHVGPGPDLLEVLGPIPVGGHGRLAWLARLDAIVAEDVTNIGNSLLADGWDPVAAQEAMTHFGSYLADRIVAVVAAAAGDLARGEEAQL